MRRWPSRLLTLPVLLALGLCWRAYGGDPHALDGPLLQDQRQPALLNQERLQREAEAAALKAKSNALIRECWQKVGTEAPIHGKLNFLSADVVPHDHRLHVRGQASLLTPDHKATAYAYDCRMDAGKRHIEHAELNEDDDDLTP